MAQEPVPTVRTDVQRDRPMASSKAKTSGGACFFAVDSPSDSASKRRLASNSFAAPIKPAEDESLIGLGTSPASSKKASEVTKVP